MGCCISRPAGGPNSPYPGTVGASDSGRAVHDAPQQQQRTRPSTDEPLVSAPASAPRRTPRAVARHPGGQPLAQHINKPLRWHEWTSKKRTWTRAAIDRERAEFFETRVTGRPEVWQTLHAALDMMWLAGRNRSAAAAAAVQTETVEGEGHGNHDQNQNQNQGQQQAASDGEAPGHDDASVALATAQTILSAADVTLPTGDLAQGAYDALGNYYALPEHVVADPVNMVGRTSDAPEAVVVGGHAKADPTAGHRDDEDEGGYDDGDDDGDETAAEAESAGDVARKRDEKGKAVVVHARDKIKIRARLSEGAQDVTVTVGTGDTVRSIARRVADDAKLPSDKKIRIAYMGKMLKEGSPLPAQGWKAGHVVNALVFSR